MVTFETLITSRAAALRIELLQFLKLPELLKLALLSKRAYAFIDPNSNRFGCQGQSKVKLHLARLAYHYLQTVKSQQDTTEEDKQILDRAYLDHRGA